MDKLWRNVVGLLKDVGMYWYCFFDIGWWRCVMGLVIGGRGYCLYLCGRCVGSGGKMWGGFLSGFNLGWGVYWCFGSKIVERESDRYYCCRWFF